ncbi:hypothetical protein K8R66_04755 [bacterium]|nr:hypothetical protein [bacterium]
MIKILGKIIIRPSGFSILKFTNYAIKMPWSISAIQEIKMEKKNLQIVQGDKHFSKYTIKYKIFFLVQIMPYLNKASKDTKIELYFKQAFQDEQKWKLKILKNTINHIYFLNFIKKYFKNYLNFWKKYLNTQFIKSSSCHGDFHSENVLVKDKKLFFIDWTRYNSSASRYFDLIDYYIFLKKSTEESWMDFWIKLFLSKINSLFDIEINRKYLLAYAIWKTTEELKTLYLRKDLSKYKIKKYIKFIKILRKSIQDNKKL